MATTTTKSDQGNKIDTPASNKVGNPVVRKRVTFAANKVDIGW